MPDKKIAEKYGLTVSTVASARQRRDIEIALRENDNPPELLGGPYLPPIAKPGDWLDDAINGAVQVGRFSDGRISWPCRKKTGKRSLILCGDLERAVKTESAIAIMYWFGVSEPTLTKWRGALGVDRKNNPGTQKIYKDLCPTKLTPERAAKGRENAMMPEALEKQRQKKRGKPILPQTRAAQLAAAKRPKPEGWGKRANAWMMAAKNTRKKSN
jgi:hypothetical protein